MKVSELIEVLQQHDKNAEIELVISIPFDTEKFEIDFVSKARDSENVIFWPKCDLWPRYPNRMQEQVYRFMRAVDLPLDHEYKPGFENLTQTDFDRLISLVDEEVNSEFIENMFHLKALCSIDGLASYEQKFEVWAQIIDDVCDIIVVVFNTVNSMGCDIKPFFDEVQRANMSKVGGPVREDGKRLKPKGWKPPDIKGILRKMVMKDL